MEAMLSRSFSIAVSLSLEATAEGVNLKGKKRTTLKLFIPNLTFPEPVEMGENVWIYMGELCPAYCLFTPWEETKEN